jgi:hypothetical protein
VSFAAITLSVASQRVLIVVRIHFVIDSVRKLLDTFVYTGQDHILKSQVMLRINSATITGTQEGEWKISKNVIY